MDRQEPSHLGKPWVEKGTSTVARRPGPPWTALSSALCPTAEPPSELAIFKYIPAQAKILVGSQSRFLAGAKCCFSLESGRHSFLSAPQRRATVADVR